MLVPRGILVGPTSSIFIFQEFSIFIALVGFIVTSDFICLYLVRLAIAKSGEWDYTPKATC